MDAAYPMVLSSLRSTLVFFYGGRPLPGPWFRLGRRPPPPLLIRVLPGVLLVSGIVDLVVVRATEEFRDALFVNTVTYVGQLQRRLHEGEEEGERR